jgi:hypothetical protein
MTTAHHALAAQLDVMPENSPSKDAAIGRLTRPDNLGF